MEQDTPADEAAKGAVDPDRLLPGETETAAYPEDVTHWLAVYRELLAFKESLIGATSRWADVLTQDASREVRDTDLKLLEAEAARFRSRLSYWQAEADALAETDGDSDISDVQSGMDAA